MKDTGEQETEGDDENLLNVGESESIKEYFSRIDQEGQIEEESNEIQVNSDSDDDGIMYPSVDPKDWM